MSPDRDLATTSPPSRQDLATVPEQPQIEPGEMYTGGPFVLEMHPVEASWKHSIGWIQALSGAAAPASSSSGPRSPAASASSNGSR
jgi:hypothetical protein